MNRLSIGVLTSGGDSPGMNACIRAVVRTALYKGYSVYGIKNGYSGLLHNDIIDMNSDTSVSGIIALGGTILKTSRCKEFYHKEGRQVAAECLKQRNINALIVIGGDGSFTGASLLSEEQGIPVICLPGTIDNDIYGTDMSIGYDTAINTALSAIDKIRDTATSHERIFLIEVMGRDSGHITVATAISSGAEKAIVPEHTKSFEEVVNQIRNCASCKEGSSIIILAEGLHKGEDAKLIKAISDLENEERIRYTRLGHIQRGGSPSAYDRILASRLGVASVHALEEGQSNIMIGLISGKIKYTQISEAISKTKDINQSLYSLVDILH